MRVVAAVLCFFVAGCLSFDPSAGWPSEDEPLDIRQLPDFSQADQDRLTVEFDRAYPVETRDANGDGCYDQAEFANQRWARFMAFDLDRSGTVSRAEYLSVVNPIDPNPNETRVLNRRVDSYQFGRADRNGDGELTREEAARPWRAMTRGLLTLGFYADRCLD